MGVLCILVLHGGPGQDHLGWVMYVGVGKRKRWKEESINARLYFDEV